MKRTKHQQTPALLAIREATAALTSLRRMTGASCAGKVILWVDDHPENNRIPRRMIEEGNATVIVALSTDEAVSVLEQRGGGVHLVISDMGRGADDLAGMKMLEALHNAASTMPAIIYSDNPVAEARREEIQRLGGIGPILGPKNLIERISALFAETGAQQSPPLPRAREGQLKDED